MKNITCEYENIDLRPKNYSAINIELISQIRNYFNLNNEEDYSYIYCPGFLIKNHKSQNELKNSVSSTTNSLNQNKTENDYWDQGQFKNLHEQCIIFENSLQNIYFLYHEQPNRIEYEMYKIKDVSHKHCYKHNHSSFTNQLFRSGLRIEMETGIDELFINLRNRSVGISKYMQRERQNLNYDGFYDFIQNCKTYFENNNVNNINSHLINSSNQNNRIGNNTDRLYELNIILEKTLLDLSLGEKSIK